MKNEARISHALQRWPCQMGAHMLRKLASMVGFFTAQSEIRDLAMTQSFVQMA